MIVDNFNHPEQSHISLDADIEPSIRDTKTLIGDNCHIDSFVKIKHIGGTGDIIIGDNVYINSGTVIFSGNGVKIGNDVLIAPNCSIMPVNHAYKDKDRLIREQGFMPSRGGIIIEDNVWIGAGSIILDGAHIGKGAVIAAGSVVRGYVSPHSLYTGGAED